MADNKLQTLIDAARYRQRQPADYKDVALSARTSSRSSPIPAAIMHPSTAWHAQFEDVNNDGIAGPVHRQGQCRCDARLRQQDPEQSAAAAAADGKFIEVGDKAGVASMQTAPRRRRCADFNLDGLLDLVVVNRNNDAQIWRNTTADAGHWLDVRLEEPGANRDAIGAWIEDYRRQRGACSREITVGGGHASGQATWIHFGLADMTDAQIEVTWPDGTKSDPAKVNGNAFYIVSPGKAPQPWSPAS